ncbi:Rne/Rng family ribonuclease [Heyndrickxia sporothermodurans]|uniref:Rne/Rng family ribonuclease n=1 Tax=Heyndrickxia sporothermodurans TaxID=46224 RepID=UPI0035D99B82
MMNEIVINYKTSEKRFATVENDKVTKIFIEQPQDETKVGNIYVGKVIDVKNGMNACFVDIGTDKHGYVHRDQLPSYIQNEDPNKQYLSISKFVQKGEKLIVQVKKDETTIKGPLLTAVIELSGKRMVYIPEGGYIAVSKKGDEESRRKWRTLVQKHQMKHEGFIIRTNAFHSSEEEWLSELNMLRQKYVYIIKESYNLKPPALLEKSSMFENELMNELTHLTNGKVISDDQQLLQRLKQNHHSSEWEFSFHYSDENIFATYKIESEIEKSLRRVIWLENGSYLVIDETEALVSIDVNTGKFSGTKDFQDTVLQTNILAAKEMVRQLIIRDYGGIILVDFIDMKNEKHRQLVQKTIEEEVKKDSKYTRLVGFTTLGIFQLTRKKTKKSLAETLLTQCPVCAGRGKVESPETMAFRLERELWEKPFKEHEAVLIELTDEVKTIFCGENNVHLKRIEQSLHVQLFFSIIPSCRPIYYIRHFGSRKEISAKMNNGY